MRGLAVVAVLLVAHSHHDGRMAVIVGESGDSGPTPRLVVLNGDGTHARTRLGWVYHASLSSDGRLVAYDTRALPDEIWLAATDGSGRGRLLARNASHVDLSPRGDAIVFVRYRHGCCGRPDLWTEDLRDGKQRLVTRNGSTPDWSPDGKRLAFVRGRNVWVVPVAGGKVRRVIRNGDRPRWSPDGSRIAFVRDRGADSSSYGDPFIYVARADGKAEHRVAEGDSAAWSHQGTELAITESSWILGVRVDGTHRRVAWAGELCEFCSDIDWAG